MPTGSAAATTSIYFTIPEVKDNQSLQLQRVEFEVAVREVILAAFPAVDPSIGITFSFTPPPVPAESATEALPVIDRQ